ncbi:MAG: acetyltransferase [Chitinophagaceae bacterium]
MNKEKIIVFGTGDIAQLAHYYFTHDSNFEVVAFTVDRAYCHQDNFEQKPLIPFDEIQTHFPPASYSLFVALSYAQMNQLREKKYHEAKAKGYSLVSYISSRCSYLSQFPAGENCFILENNTIQPFVQIGHNVTLWSGNHIGHHSIIANHNFISSQVVISGHCHIDTHCFIGVNACIAHQVQVAKETLIGAGCVITKNTSFQSVHVPARSVQLKQPSASFTL